MTVAKTFADKELGKRLEAAEAFACLELAKTRRRLFPESGSEWMTVAGTIVVFDGVEAAGGPGPMSNKCGCPRSGFSDLG
jgi:hypothetical protein